MATSYNESSRDPSLPLLNPTTMLLDAIFPGFTLVSTTLSRHTSVDITRYFPFLLTGLAIFFAWDYIQGTLSRFAHKHLMSRADIRVDDEIYNMVMKWVAVQPFAARSRQFVANTNINSRMWYLWYDESEDRDDYGEDEVTIDDDGNEVFRSKKSKEEEKKLSYTPGFGNHWFWYQGRPFIFSRSLSSQTNVWGGASENEEITIYSLGRNPVTLKQLLNECRQNFIKLDQNRTIIYRGGIRAGGTDPAWTRCVSRVSRPFSTVVLDEKVKADLLVDMKDYLHPLTRRWYANRGIPYRRGYLLYGPPGTGKSSLSFAIAGYFDLRIYIVSLNSSAMTEENLGTLFTELPKRCIVLLEDIDTAGLTNTRKAPDVATSTPLPASPEDKAKKETTKTTGGRISLSGLLNVIDGVASQEGRILIMTTNHLENLDEALIRPGRVDMTIKFDLASTDMIRTIFCAIYATLEGDLPLVLRNRGRTGHSRMLSNVSSTSWQSASTGGKSPMSTSNRSAQDAALEKANEDKRAEEEKIRIDQLAQKFADIIPAGVFSPAEIQGYLLKWKRDPERATAGAAQWITDTLEEKQRKKIKEKEEKEKEEKEEKEKKEKEEKEKEKEEKEEKEKEEKEKKEKEEKETTLVSKLCSCKTLQVNGHGEKASSPITNGIEVEQGNGKAGDT